MAEPLTIAVAQPPCVAHDVLANAAAHASLIRRAHARVVVFPELSLTGYEMDADPVGQDDERLSPIINACAETGTTALVGAVVPGPRGRQIATLAIDATGASVAYRKMWLGSEESQHFVPGDVPAVVAVDGWRLGLAICKDTSVARHQADTAALGMDVYVASTLMFDHEASLQDDRAKAIAMRHAVWVAVASFAGPTGSGYDRSAARSGIWGPDGEVVAQTDANPGSFARAQLDAPAA